MIEFSHKLISKKPARGHKVEKPSIWKNKRKSTVVAHPSISYILGKSDVSKKQKMKQTRKKEKQRKGHSC